MGSEKEHRAYKKNKLVSGQKRTVWTSRREGTEMLRETERWREENGKGR